MQLLIWLMYRLGLVHLFDIVSNRPEELSVSAFAPKLAARELEVPCLESLDWDTFPSMNRVAS